MTIENSSPHLISWPLLTRDTWPALSEMLFALLGRIFGNTQLSSKFWREWLKICLACIPGVVLSPSTFATLLHFVTLLLYSFATLLRSNIFCFVTVLFSSVLNFANLLYFNVFHLPTLHCSNVLRLSGLVKRRDFTLHWFTNGGQSCSILSGAASQLLKPHHLLQKNDRRNSRGTLRQKFNHMGGNLLIVQSMEMMSYF